ncbi:MAG: type II secretion system F family protein [Nocardioidaceae bacterium]
MSPAFAAVPAVLAALAFTLAMPPPARRPHAGTGCRGDVRPASRPASGRVLATLGVATGATALLGLPIGAVVGSVAAVVTWRLVGRMESPAVRRRRERLAAQLPHLVDLMAAMLAVGLAPETALSRVASAVGGPAADELTMAARRLALGVPPVTAWQELGRHPELGPLGRCVARSVDGGSSVSEAMTRLADDLRGDLRSRVEARARSVGVRAAVPLGVCLLPAFVLVGVVPMVAGTLPGLLGR